MPTTRVVGLRVESSPKSELEDNGVPKLLAYKDHVLRLFGEGFTKNTVVTFTHKQENCLLPVGAMFPVSFEYKIMSYGFYTKLYRKCNIYQFYKILSKK